MQRLKRDSEEWKRKEQELRNRRNRQEQERREAFGREPRNIPQDESHSVTRNHPTTEEPTSNEEPTVEIPVSLLARLSKAAEIIENQHKMPQEQRPGAREELDTGAINRAARAQVADEENREKAKNWQIWVHAIVMLPVLIGVMINYGWIEWIFTFTAWLAIVPWYCVSWVCGKIAYGIVRANR